MADTRTWKTSWPVILSGLMFLFAGCYQGAQTIWPVDTWEHVEWWASEVGVPAIFTACGLLLIWAGLPTWRLR